MPLISTEALTDQQIASYHRDGYLVLRGVFSPSEVASWQQECDRLLHSEIVNPRNLRTPFRMNSGNTPERIDPVVDISPIFAALVTDARIEKAVDALFADKAVLFKDKLIFKLPGTDGYTMHQDQAWWQFCPADDILSVSIAIDGASPENGTVELFSDYHHQMLTPPGVRTNFEPEQIAHIDPNRGTLIETQPGDVVIFHSLTPHQSGRNTSDRPRRSLYLSYSATRAGDVRTLNYAPMKEQGSDKKAERYFL